MRLPRISWLPLGLCCVPGLAVAALLVIGTLTGSLTLTTMLNNPLALGLLMLSSLACSLSMVLMMRRLLTHSRPGRTAGLRSPCCAQTDSNDALSTAPGQFSVLD